MSREDLIAVAIAWSLVALGVVATLHLAPAIRAATHLAACDAICVEGNLEN